MNINKHKEYIIYIFGAIINIHIGYVHKAN